MNALIHADAIGETGDTTLVEVDFKWLMAGQGCWIDTVRLHRDSVYAHACFARAQVLQCEPLSLCVRKLRALLGTPEGA